MEGWRGWAGRRCALRGRTWGGGSSAWTPSSATSAAAPPSTPSQRTCAPTSRSYRFTTRPRQLPGRIRCIRSRSLQNAMIELINADYADFVNLSTNLVNLGGGLAKLDADLAAIHEVPLQLPIPTSNFLSAQEFAATSRSLSSAIGDLDVHLEQKRIHEPNRIAIASLACEMGMAGRSRRAQNEIEDRLSLISSLGKAQRLLSTLPWPQVPHSLPSFTRSSHPLPAVPKEKRAVMVGRVSQLLHGIRFKGGPSLASPPLQAAYSAALDQFQVRPVTLLGGEG